jgi:quinol monooxygenase YgiN
MPKKCIVAEFEVVPEKYEAFDQIMREHARKTKETEPGCVRFDVLRVTDAEGNLDRARLVLIEVYADEAAYHLHSQQPRLVPMRESYAGMFGGRRVVRGTLD